MNPGLNDIILLSREKCSLVFFGRLGLFRYWGVRCTCACCGTSVGGIKFRVHKREEPTYNCPDPGNTIVAGKSKIMLKVFSVADVTLQTRNTERLEMCVDCVHM